MSRVEAVWAVLRSSVHSPPVSQNREAATQHMESAVEFQRVHDPNDLGTRALENTAADKELLQRVSAPESEGDAESGKQTGSRQQSERCAVLGCVAFMQNNAGAHGLCGRAG